MTGDIASVLGIVCVLIFVAILALFVDAIVLVMAEI